MEARRSASGSTDMSNSSSGDTLYDAVQPSQPSTSKPDGTNQFRWSEQSRIWLTATKPETKSEREHGRTLVLCFDGTGDQFDSDNSNVVQLVATLKKDDTSKQLVYYQTGIGTYTDSAFKAPLLSGISQVLDEMLAWNISSHIQGGYGFLMENYTQGDKICIFGFSRGAYTARALAGMLQKIGLLPPHNHQQIPFAYDMYIREDEEGIKLSGRFKRTFCRDVTVEFLGVWDTVASVGIIPQHLPFVTKNNGIKYLRHALALDERRIKFLPSYCVDPKHEMKRKSRQMVSDGQNNGATAQKLYEDMVNEAAGQLTDVQEVWFAGVHTDVGGGSVKNDTPHALARIPLRWMIRECFNCDTGLIFDAVMLQQLGLAIHVHGKSGPPVLGTLPKRLHAEPRERGQSSSKPSLAWSIVSGLWGIATYPVTYVQDVVRKSNSHTKYARLESKRATLPVRSHDAEYRLLPFTGEEAARHEAQEEHNDALSPLFDQLTANWVWHILEWIPVRVKKQKAIVHKDPTGYMWIWNRGRGRKIYKNEMKEGMKVHRSVKTRLEAGPAFDDYEGLYWPKVRPNLPAQGVVKSKDPVRLDYHDWNVDEPVHWEWVN